MLGTLDTVKAANRTDMNKKLRITDIVSATGLSKSTLIRYEEDGRLPSAKRDGRGWRQYTEHDRDRIVAILKDLKLI